MDLPNLLNRIKSSEKSPQQFLAVEIGAQWIKTASWTIENDITKITDIGKSIEWDGTKDTLITSTSKSLSHLQHDYPKSTIFGLESDWVADTNLEKDKKPLLSALAKSLHLKPLGFVVTLESIIEHFKMIEGGPLSAIIIHLSQKTVDVSIVKLGRLVGTKAVGLSEDIANDVEEALARLPQSDSIPSRMIVYNANKDLEIAKQTLISHDWLKSLPFLHIPKIETLANDGAITAIAVAGGGEVVKALNITKPQIESYDMGDTSLSDPQEETFETWAKDEVLDPIDQDVISDVNKDFGFTDVDINDLSVAVKSSTTSQESTLPESDVIPVDPQVLEPHTSDKEFSKKPKKALKIRLPKVKIPAFPKIKLRSSSMMILTILVGILLAVGAGLAYWFIPKATLTITVAQKTIQKNLTAELSTKASEIDLEKLLVPATLQTVEVSGTVSKATTGTKTIGNRAKGRVAIYNRTLQTKTLSQGTTIEANGLRFTLDEDTRIASASTTEQADFSLTTTPSKAEASVTAIDIGSNYNLPADSTFDVANLSQTSFVAKSVTEFSGGSSQEVPAVSQRDVTDLTNMLIKDLQQEIASKVNATNNQAGVVPASEPEIIEEAFSSQIGEQADSLELSSTISQEIYTYNTNDFNILAQQFAAEEIPTNYTLDNTATKIEVVDTSEASQSALAVTANIDLKVIPIIDTSEIAREITGKFPAVTQDYIRSLPGYVKAEIEITPALPGSINTFPRITKNIVVTIVTTD